MITMKLDPKDWVETGWKGEGHDNWKDKISPPPFFFLLVVYSVDEGND